MLGTSLQACADLTWQPVVSPPLHGGLIASQKFSVRSGGLQWCDPSSRAMSIHALKKHFQVLRKSILNVQVMRVGQHKFRWVVGFM